MDARTCISYLTIEHDGKVEPDLAARMGSWTFGCDVCQEVCPFNHARPAHPLRAPITEEPDFINRRSWPTLAELVQVDDAVWNALTKGSAVRRTGREGLQRNARINLECAQESTIVGPQGPKEKRRHSSSE